MVHSAAQHSNHCKSPAQARQCVKTSVHCSMESTIQRSAATGSLQDPSTSQAVCTDEHALLLAIETCKPILRSEAVMTGTQEGQPRKTRTRSAVKNGSKHLHGSAACTSVLRKERAHTGQQSQHSDAQQGREQAKRAQAVMAAKLAPHRSAAQERATPPSHLLAASDELLLVHVFGVSIVVKHQPHG